MKSISKALKRVNPKLYAKRKRMLAKQLKENKQHRKDAMQFEDYSWMEMFK
jgi:hypothetical protein